MNIDVETIAVIDLGSVIDQGLNHKKIGGLIDMGSCFSLVGIDSGSNGIDTILERVTAVSSDVAVADIRQSSSMDVYDPELSQKTLYEDRCLILLIWSGDSLPWALICSHGLPACGPLPPKSVSQLELLVKALRNEQPVPDWFSVPRMSGAGYRDLTYRLRQLYGEGAG